MKNVGFDDSAFSHGRKSSFVSLTSSQQMAQWHAVCVSSQGPVPGAAEKLPRSGPFSRWQVSSDQTYKQRALICSYRPENTKNSFGAFCGIRCSLIV